jgi:hypothetical protein
VTSKPGDGLMHYSFEQCQYLNDLGINAKLIIIPHYKFTKETYIEALTEKYIHMKNVYFDYEEADVNLIMGRSMITLAYKSIKDYDKDTQLTLRLLFKKPLISVYSENHPKEYPLALEFFKPEKIIDLCDHEVYVNGTGRQFEKIINYSVYKPIVKNVKFKYLFLGTNESYYTELKKHISKYQNHGILAYKKDKYLDYNLNHIYVPVKNILGLFDTYVYTKHTFDPAPRLMQECRYFGMGFEYVRDKNIKDAGPVYYKRPANCLTDPVNKGNIEVIIKAMNDIL